MSRSGGISTVDLLELPPLPGRIMRLLLRQGPMAHDAIAQALSERSGDTSPAPADLDGALADLLGRSWVEQVGAAPEVLFRVVLKSKAGHGRRSGVWAALESPPTNDSSES
jgi:hypothetical protein